jgi:D-alanyl-D-alanine carboxypeptidase/D-alanyl-D-alanine-endopeptidase (penicillin-binding protein 4)
MYDAMKKLFLVANLILAMHSFGQTISTRIQNAYEKFENDLQLSNAVSSLYVINANTGEVVFDRNSGIGLATASTLKVITAATAYELLGRDFRYETKFGYAGRIKNKSLSGIFFIKPSGDPTLGSWRWKTTSDTFVLDKFFSAIKTLGINKCGGLKIDNKAWNSETIPGGWIWEDIGNYYGAGATGFNWRENQYDIVLRSTGKIGDTVSIVNTKPKFYSTHLISFVTAAAKGSGDNAYVFYPLTKPIGFIRGTIPVNENAFTISASVPDPAREFDLMFRQSAVSKLNLKMMDYPVALIDSTILFTHYSPTLDSIIYWFLKKSINLYGEALTKTFAYQKKGFGETEKGVEFVKNFWKEKEISPAELNMVDGSGLSPLNRVTTHAQVMILKYAKNQPWFNGYYNAFPEYNGMKMKSGTIRNVKGFCGYQKSKDGNEYIFSFLVNNYNGSASAIVQKMYKVLDELK